MGTSACTLAATDPALVDTLVAMSAPTGPIEPDLRRRIRLLLPIYRMVGARGPVWPAIVTTLFTDRTRHDDPEAINLLRRALRASGRSMIPAIQTAILHRTDLTWAAAAITCPVLFVTTDDRGEWTPDEARTVARTMHDAREITVRGARVIPSVEQPTQTVDAVLAFWLACTRQTPPPGAVVENNRRLPPEVAL